MILWIIRSDLASGVPSPTRIPDSNPTASTAFANWSGVVLRVARSAIIGSLIDGVRPFFVGQRDGNVWFRDPSPSPTMCIMCSMNA